MRASPRMSSSGSEEVNSALLRISGTPPPRSRSRVFAAHTLAGQSVYLRAQGAHGWVASSHLVRDSCEYLATGAIAACMDNDPVWGRRAVGPEEIILCVVRAVASGAVRSARRRMCRPLAGITYGRFGSDHVSSSVKARAAGMDSTGGRLSRVGCLLVSWRRRSHDQLPACSHPDCGRSSGPSAGGQSGDRAGYPVVLASWRELAVLAHSPAEQLLRVGVDRIQVAAVTGDRLVTQAFAALPG